MQRDGGDGGNGKREEETSVNDGTSVNDAASKKALAAIEGKGMEEEDDVQAGGKAYWR